MILLTAMSTLVQECWFLSLATKEFWAKNSNARGSLFRKSTLEEKNEVGCSVSHFGLLEGKLPRQKKWAIWAVWTQKTSYRSKRRALGDRFRGLAQDKLLLPAASLVIVSWGPLELRRKIAKIHAWGKKEQAYSRKRAHVCWVLCLKGFYLFSKGRNFKGSLRRGSQ